MNNQLTSAKSFWVSERDKQLSTLDILLNRSVSSENPELIQEKINLTLLNLSQAINTIQTLESLINSMSDSEKKS
jgi:hypothetical protein